MSRIVITPSFFKFIAGTAAKTPREVLRATKKLSERIKSNQAGVTECAIITENNVRCIVDRGGKMRTEELTPVEIADTRKATAVSAPTGVSQSDWEAFRNVLPPLVSTAKSTPVPEDVAASRLAICRACPHFLQEEQACGECGCRMQAKTTVSAASCPLEEPKWGPYVEE